MTMRPKSVWPKSWPISSRPISSAGADLRALLGAVKRSSIIVKLAARLSPTLDWASVRKSPDVDAYVLAWIASHVRGPRRAPHKFT
jgi:hypothetical protein